MAEGRRGLKEAVIWRGRSPLGEADDEGLREGLALTEILKLILALGD